jgi:hypothetical protein
VQKVVQVSPNLEIDFNKIGASVMTLLFLHDGISIMQEKR